MMYDTKIICDTNIMHAADQWYNMPGHVRHKHNPNMHGTAFNRIIH